MLEIRNGTPYPATLIPGIDKQGVDFATVVIKATFNIEGKSTELAVAEQQIPLVLGDEFYGEPGTSSVRYESEMGPCQPGTGVVLIGHARSRKPVTSLDVALSVGPLQKVVRVIGDRVFVRAAGAWQISDPVAFTQMPLVYERCFGGADGEHFEERNPVGTGFVAPGSSRDLEGVALPNLEHPGQLMRQAGDRPPPTGFGFIGRHWAPRIQYAGTYDQQWHEERCPLLPDDFDERYFQGATPDLVSPTPLQGGEPVTISNVTERDYPLSFNLPIRTFTLHTSIKQELSAQQPQLDVVIIEPNEKRVTMTWRARIDCGRDFLYIDYVRIEEQLPT